MTKKEQGEYKVELTGPGVNVSRPISEEIARQVLVLVLGGGADTVQSKQDVGRDSGGAGDGSSPKNFMTSKRPATDMERIACLAYFLTHYRKVPSYKTKELTELNIEAAQQKMSNPSATARNAVNEGYLSLLGGGRKQITARGEALVDALPDRDKVKAALAAHPIRKSRKRRTGRKPKK
jgi:hypothetical protein